MADEQQIRVVITGVADDLRRALDGAKGDLGGLSAAIKAVPEKIKVDVQAETAAAIARLRDLQLQAGRVPDKIRITADADTGIASAKLDLLQAKIRATERDAARLSLGLGGGGGGGGFARSLTSGGLPGAGPLALGATGAPLAAGAVGSAIPIIGSAGAGLLGLGALATGVLGIGGVGLGSMLGVLVQAKTGISNVSTALNALEKAQSNYGASSKQAQQAQANLNTVMADAGPQASAIAKQLGALGDLWTQVSGPATKALDQIIIPGLKVVRDLMPTVAGIAKQAFDAIGRALDPIFKGLASPAFKKVLTDLGDAFAKLAPPLIGAFSNLMRAFFNVAVAAAPYVIQIAQAFERWTKSFSDSLAPGAHLNDLIKGLVSQAHSWWELLEATGRLLVTVFSAGAQQGQGFVNQLTALLGKWNAWLNTGTGQAAMHKFFADSLNLLKAVAGTLGAIAPLLASLATGLIPAMTLLLKPLAELLTTISQFVNHLSQGLPPVIKALPGLAVAVGVLASWKALQAVVSATTAAMLGKGGRGAAAEAAPAAKGAGGIGLGTIGLVAAAAFVGLTALSDKINGDVSAGLKKMRQELGDAISAGDPAKIAKIGSAAQQMADHLKDAGIKGAGAFGDLAHAADRAVNDMTLGLGVKLGGALGNVQNLFRLMAGDAGQSLHTIMTQVASSTLAIKDTIDTNTTAGRLALATNFTIAAQDVRASMQAGVINTKQGLEAINKLVNQALKALGGKPLALSEFLANVGPGVVTAQQLVASGNLSQGAVNSPHATGGWIGSPGESGGDNVPIVVGRGEAILNRHQQGPVDFALQTTFGMGLGDLFQSVTRPHFMAGGGFVSTAYGPPWGGIQGGGTTATGIDLHNAPHRYIIAVDPSVIPLHSQVKVWPNPFGYTGTFAAEDTGGAIKGNRIDFYDWKGRADQNAWGVRDVSASIAGHSIAGSAGGAGTIGAPAVSGSGIMSRLVRGALGLSTKAANAMLSRLSPADGLSGIGGQGHKGRLAFPLPQGSWSPGAVDQGWDLAAAGHTPLLAVGDGTIAGHGISGFGPWAPILRLGDGTEVYYGHAGPGRELAVGSRVRVGQVLGEVGAGIVGKSTGPHLEIGFYPPGGPGAGAAMKAALGYARGGFVGGRRFASGGIAHAAASRSRPPKRAPVKHPATSKVHVPAPISNSLKKLLPADVVGLEAIAGKWAQKQSDLSTDDQQLTFTQGLPPFPAQALVTLTDADVAAMDPHGTLGLQAGDELVNQSGMTVGRFFGPHGIDGGSWVPGIDQRTGQIGAQLSNLYGQQSAILSAGSFYGKAISRESKAKAQREQRRKRVLAFLKKQVIHAKAIKAELAAITSGNLKQNLAKALSKQSISKRLSSLQSHKQTVAGELKDEKASQAALIPLERDPTHTNALQAELDKINESIGVENQLSKSGAANAAVQAAKSALLKNNLTTRLAAYAKVDKNLGGQLYDVGSGGIIGELTKQIDAIDSNRNTELQNKQGLAPTLQSVKNAITSYVVEQSGLGGTRAIQVRTPAGALTPDTANAALLALVQQQLATTQQALALSQSQFQVFQGFAPLLQGKLVGTFQSGIDFVPQTGLALVHKGERILPDPSGPQGNRAAATVHTEHGPVQIDLHFEGDSGKLVRLVDARINQKALRAVSDHSGQRARLMAGVRRP